MDESLDEFLRVLGDLPEGSGEKVIIGADLGTVTTSLAVAAWLEDAGPGTPRTASARHRGRPLEPLLEVCRRLGPERIAGVVACGVHGDRLRSPVVPGLPEEVALEQAAERLLPWDGAAAVVRIGGGGFAVLSRSAEGTWAYEKNDRCSAGTGQAAERLCDRFGCSLDEAVDLALGSSQGVALTARCAVFAKSELTHFANQGEDHGRLFRGYFEALAENVLALTARVGERAPLLLVGNGALITPLAETIARSAGVPVATALEAGAFDALGALWYGARHGAVGGAVWPDDPERLVAERTAHIRPQPAADAGPGAVVAVPEVAWAAADGERDGAVLGLDLGSTGSKAALLDRGSGRVVAGVYRRTDGNPVEAAQALVARVAGMSDVPVVAVGITGSGRDAAAAVFRAAFPESADRLLVQNEIVAHATAAARLDPDGGRSLSIVEIGGQDAKYISVRDGRVVDSDMNRVCSAGTGSFLEEQSVALGVDDIAEFGTRAALATRAPDLGHTCTVFVTDLVADALAEGYSRDEVFAGLQYSVIRNYANRVMGNRRLLDRVFFQGKPASNPSLARTLAAVTGREVLVPPDPGAMGAIGIAMLADATLDGEDRDRAAGWTFDLRRLATAGVLERREQRCGDASCGNYCRIETAVISVGGERRTIRSGGNCPRYQERGQVGRKLPREAPSPFREREALLSEVLERRAGVDPETRRSPLADDGPLAGRTVLLPYTHYTIDLAPFFATLLTRLGAAVELPVADARTLAAGDRLCGAVGSCAPVKLAHGLVAAGLEATREGGGGGAGPREKGARLVFLPKLVNLPDPGAGAGRSTCPMAQGAPEMIAAAVLDDVIVARPVLLREAEGDLRSESLGRELEDGLAALVAGAPGPAWTGREAAVRRAVRRALEDARAAQDEYDAGRRAIGERALEFARDEDYPVVVVVGENHVIHDPSLNTGIHDLIGANGAVALPGDCYPLPAGVPDVPRMHWASGGAALRTVLAAREDGDVFPLLLGAFGCGPNSLIEPLFGELSDGYPHAVFETDGHGGLAGYVTRVQAFLHAVQGYRESGQGASPVPAERLARFVDPPDKSVRVEEDTRVLFGTVGGTLGRQVVAALRGAGIPADFAGATDPTSLRAAQDACSGKECLPYQLIWGSLEKYFAETPPPEDARTLFISVGNGFRSCRANIFPLGVRLGLERLGLQDRVAVGDLSLLIGDAFVMPVVWSAVVAQDLLVALHSYHLAGERTLGDSDALFEKWQQRLEGELLVPRERGGVRGTMADSREALSRLEKVVGAAAAEFAALPKDGSSSKDLRDVLLAGDIFLRVNEWGNDDLQRRLAALGLRILSEPFGEFFELLAYREIQELPTLSRQRLQRKGTLRLMRSIVDRLLSAARQTQPWLFWHDIAELEAASRELFDGYPFGETITTVGSALLTWRTRPIDGVVAVAPRGCGPGLIAEALLRRRADIPSLFVYNDGDPLEEERLAGFAWRLHTRPPRALGTGAAAR